MSSPAEISAWLAVLYQSFINVLPTAHVMSLTCTLSLSFILISSFLAALSLARADIRPIRASRHCSHPLLDRPFVTAVSLSLSNTHFHTQYPISLTLSLLYDSRTHFSTDIVHPSSCLTRCFTLSFCINTSQRVQRGGIIVQGILGTGTSEVTTCQKPPPQNPTERKVVSLQ